MTNSLNYFANNNKSIRTIHIDSIGISGNITSLFGGKYIRPNNLNYNMDNPTCYDTLGASWIGGKVDILDNGLNYFFNYNSDTIVINTRANVNDNWRMCKFDDTSFIEATVTTIDTISFLGINDSVKTISIQLKNNSGLLLNSELNSYYLLLSKNYGLIRAFDFYEFPYNNPDFAVNSLIYPVFPYYDIIGISSESVGYSNLTAYAVFNYDIDDVFHKKDVIKFMNQNYSIYSYYKYSILTVIEKNFSPSENKFTYKYDRCHLTTSYFDDSLTAITKLQDTISETIDLTQFNMLNYDPIEYYQCNNLANMHFADSTSKTVCYSLFFSDNQDNNCYTIGCCVDPAPCELYIKGAGGPYGDFTFTNYDTRELIYYKKGNLEWGTPYNCDSLMSVGISEIKNTASFIFYPNPASNEIFIEISNIEQGMSNVEIFKIYGIEGKLVIQGKLEEQKTRISTKDLESGIYFIDVSIGNEKMTSKLVITK